MLLPLVAEQATDVAMVRTPQLQRIAEIELNVTRASLQLRHAILARSPQEQATALADVAERGRLIEGRQQGRRVCVLGGQDRSDA